MRDNGGIPVNFGLLDAQSYYQTISTGSGGHGAYYLYDATNIRLQELTSPGTHPELHFPEKMVQQQDGTYRGLRGKKPRHDLLQGTFRP